jgi:lysophospholipase L1-like esterase
MSFLTRRLCRQGLLAVLLWIGLGWPFGASAADCLVMPHGLIGWWPGDGNANDIAGTNHGSLQAGATANATGIVGTAFSFDGTNRFVQVPDSPALKPTNLTILCWVRFSSLIAAGNTASANQQYLIFKQNSRSASFEGFDLSKYRPEGHTNDIFAFRVSSSSGQEIEILAVTPVTTNVWYHIAGVRGPNFVQLFVNGQLEAQTDVNFPQDYGNLPLFFGTSGQSFWDRKLAGNLDEVALYNRAVPGSEILAEYNAGAAGKCKGPAVLSQPQGGDRYWSSSFNFTAPVSGALPLSCQWQKDGVPVPGGTNSSLNLTNLQLTDSGSYTLLASNVYGNATSSPAILNVRLGELYISQSNRLATLAIAGLSNQTYGIQYSSDLRQCNGWLGLANVTLTAATNVWPDQQSPTIPWRYYRLVPGPIAIPPRILTQPRGGEEYWGSSITLSSTATGDLPLSYQWQKDGALVPGVTQPSLLLTNLQTTNAGSYCLVVSNLAGTATSELASVTINIADLVIARPVGTQDFAMLTISGVTGQTYGIQYSDNLLNWVALTNITLTAPTNFWSDFQPGANLGRYYRLVAGPILAPGALPRIVMQPQSVDCYWGSSVTLTSVASGLLPLRYQWQKDGAVLAGATNPSLVITNLQMTNAGAYSVLVTNIFGATNSVPAFLNIKVADLTIGLPPTETQNLAALTVGGVSGQTYKIQCSPSVDPASAIWTDLTNLTLTAATNTWNDPWPAQDPSRYYRVAQSSPWEYADIGAVWSDDFNRASLGTNWVVLGGLDTRISKKRLLLNQSSINLSQQLYYQPWLISSDAWTIRWTQHFGALNANSFGVGVGIKNFQAAGGNDRGYNGLLSGAGAYMGKMNIQRYDGSQHVLIASGSAIALAAGDLIDCTLSRAAWTISATASNRANGQVSSISISFTDAPNLPAPTISRVCIYPFLGTVYLDDLSFNINHRKPARFLVIGASSAEGYDASSYSKTFISVMQSNFTQVVCNESSSYNTTTNAVSTLPEILAHNPKTAILTIGGNDLQFGYPATQWQSAYSNLVVQLQAAGVKVKHCLTPPRNTVNLVPLQTWVLASYPPADIIDTWTPLLTGVSSLNPAYDSGDGLHPNDAGHFLIGTIISTNLP